MYDVMVSHAIILDDCLPANEPGECRHMPLWYIPEMSGGAFDNELSCRS